MKDKIPLIIIQGQTAVGKSDLALKLAKAIGADIISADSRQIYKFMNIGTAKPSKEELTSVKHHLIDILAPDKQYNAGLFRDDASKIIESNWQKKIPTIIVGGTGFYIKSLLEGLVEIEFIPNKIREEIYAELNEIGYEKAYKEFTELYPELINRVHLNDKQRFSRAYLIWRYTGKPLEKHWERQKREKKFSPLNILINMERDLLYDRINKRVDIMVERGLFEEFNSLLKMGYDKNDPGMNTVGYKEFFDFLNKEVSFLEAIEKIKQHTRNYAKRQMTWYRRIDFDVALSSKEDMFFKVNLEVKKFLRRYDYDCCKS